MALGPAPTYDAWLKVCFFICPSREKFCDISIGATLLMPLRQFALQLIQIQHDDRTSEKEKAFPGAVPFTDKEDDEKVFHFLLSSFLSLNRSREAERELNCLLPS